NYNVSPEIQYDRTGGSPRVTGYVVSNTVRAEVRKTEDVGRVLDASLAKGANQISGLDFFASNTDEARRSALAAAVAKARSDAEAMARAAGGALGQLIEVVSTSASPRPIGIMMKAAVAREATPVEPGQELVQASVTARWMFIANPR